MIRARTFTDARQQSHSNAELNWWIFMRISGMILVFLILGLPFWMAALIGAKRPMTMSSGKMVRNIDAKMF